MPLHYTDLHVAEFYVQKLPAKLQGKGLHLLGDGPGPLVQRWTSELLSEAGVTKPKDQQVR